VLSTVQAAAAPAPTGRTKPITDTGARISAEQVEGALAGRSGGLSVTPVGFSGPAAPLPPPPQASPWGMAPENASAAPWGPPPTNGNGWNAGLAPAGVGGDPYTQAAREAIAEAIRLQADHVPQVVILAPRSLVESTEGWRLSLVRVFADGRQVPADLQAFEDGLPQHAGLDPAVARHMADLEEQLARERAERALLLQAMQRFSGAPVTAPAVASTSEGANARAWAGAGPRSASHPLPYAAPTSRAEDPVALDRAWTREELDALEREVRTAPIP
jgi:hypothetical protein